MPDLRSVPRDVACPECDRPVPRSLVALSDDRQWLVLLDPEPYGWDGDEKSVYWSVYRWNHDDMLWEFAGDETPNATNSGGIKDTGQSAEDVLANFDRERAS